jgi:uncharacterized protein
MTPQERQMLDELFARLSSLENAPRDAEALAAISDGLRRAPNALYPLVQTVLVQDEALKRADARIRELESELGIQPAPQQGGFLDSMRNTSPGREQPSPASGSVPSIRPPVQAPSKWGSGTTLQQQPAQAGFGQQQPGYGQQQPGYGQQQPGYGQEQMQAPQQGGSFLGGAASSAMGMMGGAILMQGLRGLMGGGHHGGGQGHGFGAGGQGATPGAPNPGGGGALARDAGVDDIGRGGASGGGEGGQRAGLLDTAQKDDVAGDDSDFDDDSDLGDDDSDNE